MTKSKSKPDHEKLPNRIFARISGDDGVVLSDPDIRCIVDMDGSPTVVGEYTLSRTFEAKVVIEETKPIEES